MWVYRVAPFLCLKALFMMLFIRDLSKSCGMEVYRVEKSNVWMEVALWTPKWPNDDSYGSFSETYVFFKNSNSVEKQLLNFRNTSVSHCFRNLSLTIIWNNLGLSNSKPMKRNPEFRKNTHLNPIWTGGCKMAPWGFLLNISKTVQPMSTKLRDF